MKFNGHLLVQEDRVGDKISQDLMRNKEMAFTENGGEQKNRRIMHLRIMQIIKAFFLFVLAVSALHLSAYCQLKLHS